MELSLSKIYSKIIEQIEQEQEQNPFERMSAEEYLQHPSSLTTTLKVPLSRLKKKLGEPFQRGVTQYFPDGDQTDVCWGIKDPEGENVLMIWNYQNGPAFLKKGSIDDIKNYSVFYTARDFFEKILNYLNS